MLSRLEHWGLDVLKVEFGAHQVILGRSQESLDKLPQHLKRSNVIRMTVAQAKGLEFDDVFIWDFFDGSPAEWRFLINFVDQLKGIQDTQGAKKLPAKAPLVEASKCMLLTVQPRNRRAQGRI